MLSRKVAQRSFLIGVFITVITALDFVASYSSERPKHATDVFDRGSASNNIHDFGERKLAEFEKIVYYTQNKVDESGKQDINKGNVGRTLITRSHELKEKSSFSDETISDRVRRDHFHDSQQYGHRRPQRSSSNSEIGRKTIRIVHSSEITNDEGKKIESDLTGADGTRIPNNEHEVSQRNEIQDNKGSRRSLSQKDIIYQKTLDVCSRRSMSNGTNDTSHDNTTMSHEDKHHDKCAHEMASGVAALWGILYTLIIFFIFIGLAIICDDFFIASLEAISQRLNLSEDVAGATFMAAGSSAPELFISIAGAGAGSDVGVGTIVGSAVFNLLIIIALTAALAGKVLCLDWRPFVRDSIFYSLSIIAFIVFSMDTVFQIWESLLLLALYILYIVIMKFNTNLMNCMAKWKCCSCFESKVSPEEVQLPTESNNVEPEPAPDPSPPVGTTTVIPSPVNRKINPKEIPASSTKIVPLDTLDVPKANICTPATPKDVPSGLESNAAVKSQQSSSSDLTTTAPEGEAQPNEQKTTKKDAKSNTNNICTCVPVGIPAQTPMCTCCVIHISNQPCLTCTSLRNTSLPIPRIRCSSCSSIREDATVLNGQPAALDNVTTLTDLTDSTREKSSYLPNTISDITALKRSASLITVRSREEVLVGPNRNCSNNYESKRDQEKDETPQVLRQNYMEGGNAELHAPPAEVVKNEDEPVVVVLTCLPAVKNTPPDKPASSECIPASKYLMMYIVYLLSFPWACAFTWTVPKCDTPQRRKWYMASFFLCIAWIALLSWVMIELVEKIGCLLNIDSYTMGLIIVAVGTSVPDAISSVLVAKEGCGDMAVSNALGSNVFDINLGLGLPFFLGSIITSKPISLMTPLQMCLYERLPLSVKLVPHVKFGIILLVILLIAVAVFMFVRFRLNKQVTFLFIAMYVVFMIYAFVQEKSCYSYFC